MTRLYIATALNFFFPGAGWLVLGRQPILAVAILGGMLGLTYVETSLQAVAPALWLPMFASVFAVNTALAVECFLEGRARLASGT